MRVIRIAAALAGLGAGLLPGLAALAEDAALPTPVVVIYPGDVIRDDMLADRPVDASGAGPFAQLRAQVVGKMARRTLLPGVAIPLDGVDSPRLVQNGAAVKLVYSEDGLTIVTDGAAMQDGKAGDVITVRNSDSGVTIRGSVQPDGTVKVSGG